MTKNKNEETKSKNELGIRRLETPTGHVDPVGPSRDRVRIRMREEKLIHGE